MEELDEGGYKTASFTPGSGVILATTSRVTGTHRHRLVRPLDLGSWSWSPGKARASDQDEVEKALTVVATEGEEERSGRGR
jgi:hypothetical protein